MILRLFYKKTKDLSMNDFYNPYGLMQEADPYYKDLTDEERVQLCVLQVVSFFAVLGVALVACALCSLIF